MVVTLLIPAQTAVIEAIIYAVKLGIKNSTFKNGSENVLCVTAFVLALTLSICNAVLDLNKTQKVAGSIALITQAAIVMIAQLRNVAAEVAKNFVELSTRDSALEELNEPDEEPRDQSNGSQLRDVVEASTGNEPAQISTMQQDRSPSPLDV